jgi:hypothetical protein
MAESFRVLCSDYYVNHKLGVRLDLPKGRETLLEFFERLRKDFPALSRLRRYKDEVAVESVGDDAPHRWAAVRATSVRSGVVNPPDEAAAFGLHARVLELVPYYLSVTPLDVEYVELLFGFDLKAAGNHDRIVADALLDGCALSRLARSVPGARVGEFQPLVGLVLDAGADVEAHVEVKTRSGGRGKESSGEDPISVYLTLRHYGSVSEMSEAVERLDELAERGQELVGDRVMPMVVGPLREAIAASNL